MVPIKGISAVRSKLCGAVMMSRTRFSILRAKDESFQFPREESIKFPREKSIQFPHEELIKFPHEESIQFPRKE